MDGEGEATSTAEVQMKETAPTCCGLLLRTRERRMAFCAGIFSVLGCCFLAALFTVVILGTTTAIFFYPWLCRNGVDALGPELVAQMSSGASNILFRNLNFVDGLEYSEVRVVLPGRRVAPRPARSVPARAHQRRESRCCM
eukprot:scaffold3340_cov114-Isochrysis_galbana.AAC.3